MNRQGLFAEVTSFLSNSDSTFITPPSSLFLSLLLLFCLPHHPDHGVPELGQRWVVERQRRREVEPGGCRQSPAELDGAQRVDAGGE